MDDTEPKQLDPKRMCRAGPFIHTELEATPLIPLVRNEGSVA